jgi:hypothetical protein
MMTPDDVAPLVAYLLSDASLMMSGANIDFAQNMVIGASDWSFRTIMYVFANDFGAGDLAQ